MNYCSTFQQYLLLEPLMASLNYCHRKSAHLFSYRKSIISDSKIWLYSRYNLNVQIDLVNLMVQLDYTVQPHMQEKDRRNITTSVC